MKKEEIYINLQGKTKEELTELYWLLKNNDEKLYRDSLYLFLYYPTDYGSLHFHSNGWCGNSNIKFSNKQEVTIEQLKEILQPMENKEEQLKEILRKEAKERGYTHDNFKCLTCRKSKGIGDIDKWHYCNLSDRLYTNVLGEGGNVVYENGVWAEIVSESLEQQLQKAEAEVKRLQYLFEEENKIKVGDWCIRTDDCVFKVSGNDLNWARSHSKKITDQQLINKLNELIK